MSGFWLGIYHPAEGAGHDSAVALVDSEGRVLAAHSEERFSRIKMDGGFPFRAWEALRKIYPFALDDIRSVAVPYWGQAEKIREFSRLVYEFKNIHFAKEWLGFRGCDLFQHEMTELGAYDYIRKYRTDIHAVQKADQRPELSNWADFLKYCGLDKKPLVRMDHHIAHIAGAYFTSGWNEALAITADGAGALKSAMVAVCRDGKIEVKARTFLPNSPGRFWEIITTVCGFNHHKHGGKITGLAAFGNKNAACYEVMKRCLAQKGLTIRTRLSPLQMSKALKEFSREDIAATAQRRLEEVITGLVREAVRQTGIKKIVLAGGVFANVLLNQKIYEIEEVEDVYIYPAMGDEGLAAGAALWALSRQGKLHPKKFENLYLGPEYSDDEIEIELKKTGLWYQKMAEDELADSVVEAILARKVIALYYGRMEFGPRALGHRSILYSTLDASVNQWLNERLHRSEFMPFAPVTLADHAKDCYEGIPDKHYASQFMTMTWQCTPKMKEDSPAVVHLDGSARPQLIDERHGLYFKILKKYFRKTGIPSLVNTSFNMHEEPIVENPQDSLRAFEQGGLDILILGGYFIKRRE